jgi:hypothetical protein
MPGDDAVLVNYNTFPGSGSYGTFAWQLDETIVDRYRLRIPDHVERAQAWRVSAVFYTPSDRQRLPVTVAGQPAGTSLGLGLVRVGATGDTAAPTHARLDPAPSFGQAIALRGAQVSQPPTDDDHEQDEGWIRVVLWWEAVAPPDEDYVVFVHLLNDRGELVATGDGAPLQGGFPTSLWRQADQVTDQHTIVLPGDLEPGVYAIRIGWYEPESGVRLAAVWDDRPQQDDAFAVGTWYVE